MKKYLLLLLLLITSAFAQKREFRGSWAASVFNLDWPSSRNLTPTQQRAELITILDKLQSLNMNALLLQVRPASDALYNSSIEPWSYWLTGTQGTAPNPLYDPLQFAVDEAHARGIELYAWINPFRAEANIGNYTLHSSHVVNQHPDWILTFNSINLRTLDPGKALVRNYIQSVVMEIVNNYDIDGVVFDDYFYPYPNSGAGFTGITTEDAATFASESRGFSNIGDWRRDNVNIFIDAVNNAIKAVKPYVKFGVSPFGIWKNGTPSGITGMDAYSVIYCDAVAWLNNESVDFISPQLYWEIGGGQDYSKLLPWWGDNRNGRHLYSSQALYKSNDWASDEITNQLTINRNNSDCIGSIFYRQSSFNANPHNIESELKNNYYTNIAVPPYMAWLGGSSPNAHTNLVIEELNSFNRITWTNSTSTERKFNLIYKSSTSPVDVSDESNIIGITSASDNSFEDYFISNSQQYFYAVTSLNKFDIESSSLELGTNFYLNTQVMDNFDITTGHFYSTPTFSGSTTGISASSTSARTTSEFYNGSGSLQLVLLDNSSSSSNWFVRILSGGGTPSNNDLIDGESQVGFWMKTSSADESAQVSIWIDDTDGTEKGILVDVINDGNWHLYRWDLSNESNWNPLSGNGVINGSSVTLDALIFTADNNSADWTIYIDDVYYEEMNPLPVELTSFTALAENNSVKLYWETATELNNFGFEVERSAYVGTSRDLSLQWSKVGFVEGHGNSNSPKEYSFVDNKTFEVLENFRGLDSKLQYRLKQIDYDGQFDYSETITVETLRATSLPTIFALEQNYPNPFNPSTSIEYSVPSDEFVTLKVYDILGNTVSTLVNETKEAGKYNVTFGASNLSSGIYSTQ